MDDTYNFYGSWSDCGNWRDNQLVILINQKGLFRPFYFDRI